MCGEGGVSAWERAWVVECKRAVHIILECFLVKGVTVPGSCP